MHKNPISFRAEQKNRFDSRDEDILGAQSKEFGEFANNCKKNLHKVFLALGDHFSQSLHRGIWLSFLPFFFSNNQGIYKRRAQNANYEVCIDCIQQSIHTF